MKGRPKTIATTGGGQGSSAESTGDWQHTQQLSDQTDSPPESRLPPDPPYQEEGGMPVAGGATFQGSGGSIDNSNLVTSFKGKMKLDKKQGSGDGSIPDPPKTVMVAVDGASGKKIKRPGGGKQQKSVPTSNMDLSREFSKCREEGKTRLDLSKSNINTLPPSIKEVAPALTELYLYSNRLATLPTEIGQLTSLTTLALSENVITSLPDSLQNLQNLRVLDCRHNRLSELPQVVYQLTNLTTLYLRFNRIREVGEDIGQLEKLTTLILRENNITHLPPTIGKLTKLRTLDMS